MLDAYIIDRIRRERDRVREHDDRIPLHIEPPRAPPRDEDRREDEEQKRGSTVIDFRL